MEFRKADQIRWLGLLDLQRTMQRALRRSGLPIAYSNGFNPHIVLSFASALSSGIPGDAEVLDVHLTSSVTEEVALRAMKRVLPAALAPSRVRMVDDRFPKLGRILSLAGYVFSVPGEHGGEIVSSIPRFLAREEIMALRKSKSREQMVNVRPMVHALQGGTDMHGTTRLSALVSFTEEATLKPDLLMETLCREAGIDVPEYRVRRSGLFAEVNGMPVPLMDYPQP